MVLVYDKGAYISVSLCLLVRLAGVAGGFDGNEMNGEKPNSNKTASHAGYLPPAWQLSRSCHACACHCISVIWYGHLLLRLFWSLRRQFKPDEQPYKISTYK